MSSVAPPPLRRLDKTRSYLTYAGDADRPSQEQVRTCGRKRAPPSATHYPPPTGETTCLYQNGSDAPGAAGQDGSKLETSAFHRSARDAPAMASSGIQAVLEGQVQSGCSQAKVAEETVAFIKELAGIIDCGVLNGSAASCSSWVFACANARSRNIEGRFTCLAPEG